MGASGFLGLVKKAVSHFRAGEVEVATHEKGITLNVLGIQKCPMFSMISSRGTYVGELPLMHISCYLDQGALENVGELKSTFRQ